MQEPEAEDGGVEGSIRERQRLRIAAAELCFGMALGRELHHRGRDVDTHDSCPAAYRRAGDDARAGGDVEDRRLGVHTRRVEKCVREFRRHLSQVARVLVRRALPADGFELVERVGVDPRADHPVPPSHAGQPSGGGGAAIVSRPASRQASKPPTRSAVRSRPRSISEEAARLDEYPS